jgi:hypothetical protein
MRGQRRATIIPKNPINGDYPTLKGTVYQDGTKYGQPDYHFVADPGQGISEYDLMIKDFTIVKEKK